MKKKITTKPKAGFDLVHAVIPIKDVGETFMWSGNVYVLLSIYINKCGLTIGCLCRDTENKQIVSMDPFLYEEFIDNGGVFE
jgi:hypothetical protein